MKIPEIKEIILGPDHSETVLGLIGSDKREIVDSNLWHYFVLIDQIEKLIIHQASSDRNLLYSNKKSFKGLIEELENPQFFDLLFLCTFYPILLPDSFPKSLSNEGHSSLPEFVNHVLKAGNGYLLYYHQLEILYSTLTNCSHAESYSFRRDWNLKKEYTRTIARDIIINDSYSLLDLLLEKTLDENLFFYQGNYHGAYCLGREMDII